MATDIHYTRILNHSKFLFSSSWLNLAPFGIDKWHSIDGQILNIGLTLQYFSESRSTLAEKKKNKMVYELKAEASHAR